MSKILFKLSGSIAAYKACAVISELSKRGHEVQVVATPDTFAFVGESTLEGLTGKPVLSEIHHSGEMMAHIHLNTWADICVLCAATANTIAKLSYGMADNLVSALALAKEIHKPYLIFPAMNPKMFAAPTTVENFKRLENFGFQIYNGNVGPVACGDYGQGRLMEPEEILAVIERTLSQPSNTELSGSSNNNNSSSSSNRGIPQSASSAAVPTVKETIRVLVTAGGTTEKLDAVRAFTNTSTGKTGARIAKELAQKFDVTVLGSSSAKNELAKLGALNFVTFKEFESFLDIQELLKTTLESKHFDIVIHAAAVSDFTPVEIAQSGQSFPLPLQEKLKTSDHIQVSFKRNPKLIDQIKSWSKKKDIQVFGFKLLQDKNSQVVEENLNKILKSSDYVVLNFVDEIKGANHQYKIYKDLKTVAASGVNNDQLAADIMLLIQKLIKTDKTSLPYEANI